MTDDILTKPDLTPDMYGRVIKISESGLSYTKASMSRFIMFCLANDVQINDIWVFNKNFKGSLVCVSLRIHPYLISAFEEETKGILRDPPTLTLN